MPPENNDSYQDKTQRRNEEQIQSALYSMLPKDLRPYASLFADILSKVIPNFDQRVITALSETLKKMSNLNKATSTALNELNNEVNSTNTERIKSELNLDNTSQNLAEPLSSEKILEAAGLPVEETPVPGIAEERRENFDLGE